MEDKLFDIYTDTSYKYGGAVEEYDEWRESGLMEAQDILQEMLID